VLSALSELAPFLRASDIINYDHPAVREVAITLSTGDPTASARSSWRSRWTTQSPSPSLPTWVRMRCSGSAESVSGQAHPRGACRRQPGSSV
jgi:hypothetical protein